MNIILSSYIVRASSGSIDHDATCSKFADDLVKYEAERETELETIALAVNTVFDTHKGASINMPALTSLALRELNAQPSNFAALTERVQEYVRDNADRTEKKDKEGKVVQVAEAPRTRAFCIGKGKGGGVKRWCDQPVAEKPESK
jgi:hypothetical protein